MRGRLGRATFIGRELPLEDRLSQINVLRQLDHIRRDALVAQRRGRGEIELYAASEHVTATKHGC